MRTMEKLEVLSIQEIEKDKEIAEVSGQVSTIVERAQNFQVDSNESLVKGTEVCSWIRKKISALEKRRKFFVDPLNAHIKSINQFFKENWINNLERADQVVANKMIVWRRSEQERIWAEEKKAMDAAAEKQRKLREKAEAEAAKKGIPTEAVVVPEVEVKEVQQQEKQVGAGMFKKFWDFELMDINQVPRSYLTLDERKVRQAVKDGLREIPGIRIFEREDFARR